MPTFSLLEALAMLDAHNARLTAMIERETSAISTDDKPTGATAGGDARKLRGIPAIGKSVTGAIDGTTPTLSDLFR